MTPRGRFGGADRRTDARAYGRRPLVGGNAFRLVTGHDGSGILPPTVLVEKAGAERIDEGTSFPRACRSTSRSARRSASMGFPGDWMLRGKIRSCPRFRDRLERVPQRWCFALGQSEKVFQSRIRSRFAKLSPAGLGS